MRPSKLLLPLWLSAVSPLSGCGRPASLEDCEEIVERVTVLEIKKRQPGSDKAMLKQESEREIAAHRDVMMRKCVGKRITDGIMHCVRNAKTSEEIVEECF
jgi:hypothetical protein